MWCGGRLITEERQVTCMECSTEFSNMLISETTYENTENTVLERSVSIDCVKVKSKGRHIPLPEVYPIATEKPVIACE